MRRGTKSEFYRYTLNTGAVVYTEMCTDKAYCYLVPPEDAQSIESIFVHFKMTFDAGISAPDRVLNKIGIASERPLSVYDTPTRLETIELNQAADGDGVVEVKIDLTTLLKKDNVKFEHIFGDFVQNNMTMVYIELPETLREGVLVGIINVWKIDALFTTKEIR